MLPLCRLAIVFSACFLVTATQAMAENPIITVTNIPSAAVSLNLAVELSGDGGSQAETFTFDSPLDSTIVQSIELAAVCDAYTLDAMVQLDINQDGTIEGTEEVAVNNGPFAPTVDVNFGLPAAITVSNIPPTAQKTSLAGTRNQGKRC